MHAEDYRQIIAACFPELAITRCRPVAEGWDSVAVAVNDELIFRFPKRRDVEPQYQIERRLLPALAAELRIEDVELRTPTQLAMHNAQFLLPDVAFFWPGGTVYPNIFIGHHLIHGVPLAPEHLTP